MKLNLDRLNDVNNKSMDLHKAELDLLSQKLDKKCINAEEVIKDISTLQVATPSWALGTGATRFGRFPGGGEPATLEEKVGDVGILKQLSGQTSSISLHIPWDIPENAEDIKDLASSYGLTFDSMNSNTFMDDPRGANTPNGLSYKYGSMCNTIEGVRDQAIQHNIDVIEYGKRLGSNSLTVWLADGSNYPGQANFRRQFENVQDCLQKIYKEMPEDWFMFTEHKPFEPNFYSTVNADWGSNLLLAKGTGERCMCLVDLGHHLPNTNIEQVVSRVIMEKRLAGFHFNDSKYSDDDLTVGSLKPYQLFLIFNELVEYLKGDEKQENELAWMIDASHNTKDPMEDLLQSFDAIALAYGQALTIPRTALNEAQLNNDVAGGQEILQDAYRTDVRPLVREARMRQGAAYDPVAAYRALQVRKQLIDARGTRVAVTGL
ncbi:sugar isomerase [Lentisphaera marina]|uniref:sugar isomerase n=1 Tax=Lentisphaera marina TaxID=1111041 RepID=UPI0023665DF0|nr:sugar isomerase [Lentisphaera marina]MDD7985288.1 sugar isomerase [Lentisphaera marina]